MRLFGEDYKKLYFGLRQEVQEAGYKVKDTSGFEIKRIKHLQTPAVTRNKAKLLARTKVNDTYYCVGCDTMLDARRIASHRNTTGHAPIINATRLVDGRAKVTHLSAKSNMSMATVEALAISLRDRI